jgi:glycerol-3-phosphate dehydrogenase
MILGDAQGWQDLGTDFGGGLTEAEVRYLQTHEWARSAEDVLWRRSKLGLTAATDVAEKLAYWFKANA